MIPPETSWLRNPRAQALCACLRTGGHQIYFVGGCVRNALLGQSDSDIDLATDALPERVMALGEAAGFHAVPTGIDHGTVTVVVDKEPFEVTTFRRDVETDGRHAVVAFSNDLADDARRRDFTMNALYADPEGRVLDPVQGLPDLQARRVRFIEDADARIREDYLRILRFYRFSAWYADPAQGFDAETLAAIAANLDGLSTLSAERVGQEMRKLLTAPDPAAVVANMGQIGVLHAILPGAEPLLMMLLPHLEEMSGIASDWLTRLAALGGDNPPDRLRLSRAEARQLAKLNEVGFAGPPVVELAYRHGLEMAKQVLLLRAALAETAVDKGELPALQAAANARFPVEAGDLMPELKGPALGARLRQLEAAWIASGFTLTKPELLALP